MVSTPTEYFDGIVAQFTAAFDQIRVTERDEKPERSLLELTGVYGQYSIRLYEIVLGDQERRYAYYVFKGQEVIVGFDNARDPSVAKLKYGREYKAHLQERIPHSHTENKTRLALTEEMDCARFISWVRANLTL